jgi:dTDP-4-dehydrorhamnose reductase
MKILITGAHSLLGHSLLAQETDVELIGCGRGPDAVAGRRYFQLAITDVGQVERLLNDLRPDWVINTAAVTDVDRCETDKEGARRVNLDAVSYLADACHQVDAGLVQLSTDYVFDGASGPYSEADEPHPLSYYGELKLKSEAVVLNSKIKGLVLRTLWLYGYLPGARLNLVTWPLQVLARRESLTMINDQWGNPTYVNDLAQVLLSLCRRNTTGLYHMGGATYMTKDEVVIEVARFFNLNEKLIGAVSTKIARQVAKRPLRSGLRTEALRAVLDSQPLSLTQGLEDMAQDKDFRHDFSHLLD